MNVIIIQSSFLLGSLCNNDSEVQLRKRHFSKKWIRATSNFIVLIPTRSIRQMLANFAFEDCIKAQEKKKKVDVFIHVREKNVKLGTFTWKSCSDSKEMYKKAWCTCKVVGSPIYCCFFVVLVAVAVVVAVVVP